ncbi:hypothetical protein BFL43_15450 [Williamsia sp. 1135]|nr:oxygenase MpaB family protein [Williamsia sp. 1135]ORM32465.1 hypothetical protein BFL43_15450 [Williamsia sp. 1135]
MHAPMWLGDTATAEKMVKHLHNIHQRVAGDIIDVGEPELGGYAATDTREVMCAALTEMHPMLRVYEAFAFRDGKLPHRLPATARDRFMGESARYVRLHGVPEDEIPTTMAQLALLYEKYDHLFRHSPTMKLIPETGEDFEEVMGKAMIKNFHITQIRAIVPLMIQAIVFNLPIAGVLSGRARRAMGLGPTKSRLAILSKMAVLPIVWLMQQPPIERHFMRLMWGPDGVVLIESARLLHRQARAAQSS